MKKTLCLLLCAVMMFAFAACGGKEDTETAKEYTYEIGMLTAADHVSIDDENYVQAAWEGVRQYAEEHEITYKYYEAEEPTADSMVKRVGEAVDEGVEIIVAAGPEVAEGIYAAQEKYSKVKFIYLDGTPVDGKGKEQIADNCICISFNPLQAGFLAGYSAVAEGFNQVGFMANGKTEEAQAYGYGFLQGCNEAADRFNRYTFVRYRYGSDDDTKAELQKKAKEWYDYGTKAIFAYGVNTFDGVKDAAKDTEKVVIASNVSKDYSKTVMTSAMKCYQDVVAAQLDAVYTGGFQGGKSKKLGVKAGGVGLDMEKSKFTTFNKDLYKEIVKELGDGDVELASVKSAKTVDELIAENRLYYIGLQE